MQLFGWRAAAAIHHMIVVMMPHLTANTRMPISWRVHDVFQKIIIVYYPANTIDDGGISISGPILLPDAEIFPPLNTFKHTAQDISRFIYRIKFGFYKRTGGTLNPLLMAASAGNFLIMAEAAIKMGFKVPPRSLIKPKFNSVYEARDILRNMLESIQWQENFSIREQYGIRNAYATIINNVRWIVYDNDFLEDIDAYTATKWASISVLAHEMGHHYHNHVVNSGGSTPPKELEADNFSGFVMAKLGATLQQSVAAMKAIASDRASASHPAKKRQVRCNKQRLEFSRRNNQLPQARQQPTPRFQLPRKLQLIRTPEIQEIPIRPMTQAGSALLFKAINQKLFY